VVVKKSHIFWDITVCGLLKVNQHVISVFVFEEKAKQGTSKKQAASGSSKFFPNGS
jgi:hypothetical protein